MTEGLIAGVLGFCLGLLIGAGLAWFADRRPRGDRQPPVIGLFAPPKPPPGPRTGAARPKPPAGRVPR